MLSDLIPLRWQQRLSFWLTENQRTDTPQLFLTRCLREGGLLAGIVLAVALFHPANFYIICIPLAFVSPLSIRLFAEHFTFETRKRVKESAVCDVLLQASVFPPKTPTAELLSYCARPDFGLLGYEFEKVLLEVNRGSSIETALSNMAIRCESAIIRRALHLIALGYRTGSDLSQTFRQTAEDLLETESILRERAAALLVEKYTLLFAGGLLVPAVLGLLTGLTRQLDFDAFAMLELGADATTRETLREAAVTGLRGYLVIYSVLAAFFVSRLENSGARWVLYAVGLILLSQGIFWFFNG